MERIERGEEGEMEVIASLCCVVTCATLATFHFLTSSEVPGGGRMTDVVARSLIALIGI